MKKFIGTVNGVEYNDREAFNEAARKAMEENPCLLSITSYEKYEPDEDSQALQEPEKRVFVEGNDFVIERESEKTVTDGKLQYVIPEGLEEKIRTCENKDEVKKKIACKMADWKRCLETDRERLKQLESEKWLTEQRIKSKNTDIEELEAGIEYYGKLLSFVEGDRVCPENKPCRCSKTQYSDRARELFGEMGRLFDDLGSNFSSYLRTKGLFD